jgi:hypothetical protein
MTDIASRVSSVVFERLFTSGNIKMPRQVWHARLGQKRPSFNPFPSRKSISRTRFDLTLRRAATFGQSNRTFLNDSRFIQKKLENDTLQIVANVTICLLQVCKLVLT